MTKETQIRTVFLVAIALFLILTILYAIPLVTNMTLFDIAPYLVLIRIVAGVFLVITLIMVHRYTYKKLQKLPLIKERYSQYWKTLKELGFVSIIIHAGYILGIISIGLGAYSLFLNRRGSLTAVIFGIVIIFIMFLIDRKFRK